MERREYDRLVDRYIDDVYRIALNCCRNNADAEDAVQNTFLKLLTTDTKFTDDDHIRRWLIRVAVNDCKNNLSSFWRRKVTYFDELPREPEGFSEDERWLLSEIDRLPPKYSAVLHLYYYEGYKCGEIAELLCISESNVQTRLQRARKLLKTNLEEA